MRPIPNAYVGFILVFYIFTACNNSNYNQHIYTIRANKNYAFLNPKTTPFKPADLAKFKALAYFEPDLNYNIGALIKWQTQAVLFPFPHTNNKMFDYKVAGKFLFKLNNQQLQLTGFTSNINRTDSIEVLIPFADITNGNNTYAGGRYLTVWLKPNQTEIQLDFNLAYNPYCYYNSDYSCPITPTVNNLPVSIEAGEKLMH